MFIHLFRTSAYYEPILSVFFYSRYQHCVEWAKKRLSEQGMDDSTINNIMQNYTKQINLRIETRESNGFQDEETFKMEANKEEPELLMTSSEINGNNTMSFRDNSHCDPLVKHDCSESDITDPNILAKTPSPQQCSLNMYDSCREDSYVEPESHCFSSSEDDHELVLIEEKESDLCMEEETSEKLHVSIACYNGNGKVNFKIIKLGILLYRCPLSLFIKRF